MLFGYLALIIWQRNGISFLTLNPNKIYEVRIDVQEQVFFGFAGYAVGWLGKVVIPALMVLAVYHSFYFLFLSTLLYFSVYIKLNYLEYIEKSGFKVFLFFFFKIKMI